MPLELVTIPCLTDNYAFVLYNPETDEAALIDAPEIAPIEGWLDRRAMSLTDVLVTHHHWDHIEGVDYFAQRFGARVVGAKADAHRLPPLHLEVTPGETITVCGEPCEIIDVPGHTVGHIAFYFPQSGYLFSADSLMAAGCGRLFEGTPAQMWDTMQRLRSLPPETVVCSGHEYTASNIRFALTVDPDNADLQARQAETTRANAEKRPTVPSLLSLELATNPYLRADNANLKAAVGMEHASDLEVFTEIRARKDRF